MLVGLQLRAAVTSLPEADRAPTAITGIAVVAAVIVIRLLWFMLPALVSAIQLNTLGAVRRRLPVAWAGFRGGVSLAAALAVPSVVADESPFPGRETIIVVTAGAIVVTLVGQGLTLPLVLRSARYVDDLCPRDERRLAERRAAEAALEALLAQAVRLGTPAEVVERMRAEHEYDLARAHDAVGDAEAEASGNTGERSTSAVRERLRPASADAEAELRLALLAARRSPLGCRASPR